MMQCLDRKVSLLSVKLENQPDSLHEAITILIKHGVDILSVTTPKCKISSGDIVEKNLFVDMTDSAVTLDRLKAELREYGKVLDVTIVEQQFPSVLFDDTHFPIEMLGSRAIIMREPVYGAIAKGIRDHFGSGGESFLYYIGLDCGDWLAQNTERLGVSGTDLPNFFKLIEIVHGRSKPEIINLDIKSNQVTIRLHNSFECALASGQSEPYSRFYKGFLLGVFKKIMDVTDIIEARCISTGDPYCEFQLRKS